MATESTFSTLNIYLASFLSFHGCEPAPEVRDRNVVFRFQASEDMYNLLSLYNSNNHVPLADLVIINKALRGRMLTLKEQALQVEGRC